MALLGTFANAGAASLAKGTTCFAHGLPTTPDFATWVPVRATGVAGMSIPVHLVTRGATAVIFENNNGGEVNGESLAVFFHSIVR